MDREHMILTIIRYLEQERIVRYTYAIDDKIKAITNLDTLVPELNFPPEGLLIKFKDGSTLLLEAKE